jgi:hypothetical protein
MTGTQAELFAELASLTSTDRRLSASEERHRSWLVGELAKLEGQRGIAEVIRTRDEWVALEHPHERET